MEIYEKIRNLSAGEMEFAWSESVTKGDKFKLRDDEFGYGIN